MKSFKIITLFPDFFKGPLEVSLIGKAVESEKIAFKIIDLKDFSEDKFQRCDDYPYGGGSGMVLKPEPLFRALEANISDETHVILTSPSGILLNQNKVKEFSDKKDICIICGHYEGVDQRVIDRYVDEEISIGDYVISGGEYAAMVIADAISRYVPGFMSNPDSLTEESFEQFLLEYPHYTRPADFEGLSVPEILISGNHAKIEQWRLESSIEKTERLRPDLYSKYLEIINKD